MSLTDRHIQILRFVQTFHAQRGYAPNMREIGRAVGVNSTSLISYYLDGLQDARMIARTPRVARSILLTPKGRAEIGARA